MTQEAKLKAIIEYAVRNGYKVAPLRGYDAFEYWYARTDRLDALFFSHNFCKAFFGEDRMEQFRNHENVKIHVNGWEYHLQQLAITPEEGRVDYLFDYLQEDKQ